MVGNVPHVVVKSQDVALADIADAALAEAGEDAVLEDLAVKPRGAGLQMRGGIFLQEALGQVIDALRERGITTVLITHNVRLLRRVDQIGVMQEGQIVNFGPRDEVLGQFGAARPKAPAAPAPAAAAPPRPIQVKYTQ